MAHEYETTVRRGVVAVISRADRLLVIRRSKNVAAPGRLCFPGGGIEDGENEVEALRRELLEELSVEVQPVRCVWQNVTEWNVALSWWTTVLAEGANLFPNPDEVADIHWLTRHEMKSEPSLLESNLEFLNAIDEGIVSLV
jgi:8-oxo-dGTP pyrophosphatase MutT (NUDIX family)